MYKLIVPKAKHLVLSQTEPVAVLGIFEHGAHFFSGKRVDYLERLVVQSKHIYVPVGPVPQIALFIYSYSLRISYHPFRADGPFKSPGTFVVIQNVVCVVENGPYTSDPVFVKTHAGIGKVMVRRKFYYLAFSCFTGIGFCVYYDNVFIGSKAPDAAPAVDKKSLQYFFAQTKRLPVGDRCEIETRPGSRID